MHYGAITLDSSIFDQNNLKLESGLLKKLEQFNGKPSKFILSEIIKNEVYSHLVKKISDVRNNINKALRLSHSHLTLDKYKKGVSTSLTLR